MRVGKREHTVRILGVEDPGYSGNCHSCEAIGEVLGFHFRNAGQVELPVLGHFRHNVVTPFMGEENVQLDPLGRTDERVIGNEYST